MTTTLLTSFLLSTPPLSSRPQTLTLIRPTTRRLPPITLSATTPAPDRLVSALSYTLPFLNSLHYARFLLGRAPALASLLSPILPLASFYRSVPYASFVAFFALYLGVVRNPSFSRYVRFNAMQAVVLDVLLALPTLAQRVFGGFPASGVGFRVVEMGFGGVFLFSFGCFLYGIVSCVLGRTPYLPVVAAAAERQL